MLPFIAGIALVRVLQVHNYILICSKPDIPLDKLLPSLDASVSYVNSLNL